jgi:hypothetical protein
MDRPPRTGHVLIDTLMILWGWFVSAIQYADLEAINTGIGGVVGVLSAILLLYRIHLAHEEATQDDEVEE